MPTLRQSAYNSIRKRGDGDDGSVHLRATFSEPTLPGSLIIVIAATAGGLEIDHDIQDDDDWNLLRSNGLRDIQLSVWYQQDAPSMESVRVSTIAYRSMQLRLLEYTGVAQDNALDQFDWRDDDDDDLYTGTTETLAESGELVVAAFTNQYASTTQSGFRGGLTKLYENTSPDDDNSDWERSRLTVHHAIAPDTDRQALRGNLSSDRRWLGFIATFRSGITGPARFTSTINTNVLRLDGTAQLTVFGPLRSINNTTMLGEITSQMARIGPFNYQYRLGGWSGLLIGHSTPFPVESVNGLEGWELRTSDADLPRGDGALRGVDLQTARQVMFKLSFDGTHQEIEEQADELYRTLIPQRDADWELIYRHPGRPLRIMYCRPIQLIRELDQQQLFLHSQSFVLRAADPRQYSAIQHVVEIPVSSNNDNPTVQTVLNLGNAFAYPEIRVSVLPEADTVTRVELVNETADSTFDFRAVMPSRSTLVGDMPARATGAPRSIITVDGQSKYGGWQFPREAFRLNPGQNQLYLRTSPTNSPVMCLLTYRDTWSG